jgi:hypothetical protein
MGRLRRLLAARETMQTWRPLLDARGPDQKTAVDGEITAVEQSITELRSRLTAASTAMARVRASGTVTPQGLRDYTAAGGDLGQRYQNALAAITPPTAVETSLGEQGLRVIDELRTRKVEEIPVRIAIERAFRTGAYTDEAFRAMLSQIDPATRDSILYGPRGESLPKNVKFQRLSAAYATQSMLPNGSVMSAGHLTGARGRVARGAGWLLLIQEGLNLYGEISQSVKSTREIHKEKYVRAFVRRLLFWQSLGVEEPAVVGVDDDLTDFSPTYIRDYKEAIDGLNNGDLEAFYLEDTATRPCFSKMDYLRMAARLAFYVRNEDEFVALFLNSGQDAVKWDPAGADWPQAKWYVRVAEYNTSGFNSVDERWVYDEMLTKLMRGVAGRIVENTKKLLRLQFEGKPMPAEESETGRLFANEPPRGAKKARLLVPYTESTVYTETIRRDGVRGTGVPLAQTVRWSSPPVFYVHKQNDNGHTTVTGADYNTYAALRRTSYEMTYEVGYSGSTGRRSLVANEDATVDIPTYLLLIDP